MAYEDQPEIHKNDEIISENVTEKESNILYDILIYTEWPQEPELLGKSSHEKTEDKPGLLGSWFSAFSASKSVPASLHKFISGQMSWQMAVGGEGKILAVLQDCVAEIRSSRDDFGSIIGKCNVPKDPFPQWRRVCFSQDCSMVAVSSSNGQVFMFDLLGNPLFTITLGQPDGGVSPLQNGELGVAVAGMIFIDCRLKSTQQWSSEFLVATHEGKLYSYLVSPTDGYRESHMFSLKAAYPRGISCISYHPSHHLLFISGWAAPLQDQNGDQEQTAAMGRDYGLSAWRLLSDYPHYKMVTTLEEDLHQPKKTFLQLIPGFSKHSTSLENYVLGASISPSGHLLAAVHSTGSLSLWHLPSLRLKRFWELNQQPCKVARTDLPKLRSSKKRTGSESNIVSDLNWWSDEALILARQLGAVTVSSVRSLRNLLGKSAEPFEPVPKISAAIDRKFLVLESDRVVTSKGRSPSVGLGSKVEEVSSEEEEGEGPSFLGQGMRTLRGALYYITDSEKFQPPRIRTRILTRNYRLLCLKSTTPEELFIRKLDNEEYGEALALAKVYGLDCDMVYQRQWRKTPVSLSSIQDYLSKISKRSWVLHECLERVPERLEAARGLLLYGLRKTEIQPLAQMARKRSASQEEYQDMSVQPDESQKGSSKQETTQKLLKELDFKSLTVEQRQLCQYRLKLLTFLDRLNTYEIILGGGSTALELFEPAFFSRFRVQSGLEASVRLAREGNAVAVADMLTYHGAESLSHWLPILSSFPETMAPLDYRSLLPEAGFRPDEPEVYSWDEIHLREMDWCEVHYAGSRAMPDAVDYNSIFYEENADLLKFRQDVLMPSLLSEWYLQRARQVEASCGAVDNALELIKCGRERNVQGLEQLHCELLTLEALVYECQLEETITLEFLEASPNEEKIRLLMTGSNSENFVRNCRQRLLPFLERLDQLGHAPFHLLLQYLVDVAAEQLNLCQLFLQASRPDLKDAEPLLPDMEQMICVALGCIYACKREDQLQSCCAILECLPERGSGHWNELIEKYHEQADELEKHLEVCGVMEEYGCPVTPSYVRSYQNDPVEVKKLFFSLANSAASRVPLLSETQWRQVLSKMLDMRKSLFKCVQPGDCFEVLVSCLLASGRKENISLAGTLMQCSLKKSTSTQISKLPYERSLALVLQAAEKYFNLSAEVVDPSIALARACLNLMTDHPSVIERELDLILSLSLLQEFSLNLIPLQVRLCKDRLDIVKEALRSKPQAYRNTQKLLRLATLLRVCGEDKEEREGQVIMLVAEAALQACDYTCSFQACQLLMERRYTPGWSVCKTLGACSEYEDVKCRIQLLSFSITFCLPELIEPLIISKQELELQELNELVSLALSRFFPSESEEENGEGKTQDGEHLLTSSLRQTKEISLQVLQSTHDTTRKVLASVGSAHFWKDAVRWIQVPGALTGARGNWDGGGEDHASGDNKDLKMAALPAAYLPMSHQHQELHISQLNACYNRYLLPDLPSELKAGLDILRAALLQESLSGVDAPSMDSQVLLELCRQTISEDTALALAFLLALINPLEAEELFSSLPRTALVLQVAAYFFCLCMLTSSDDQVGKKSFTSQGHLDKENFYAENPCKLIKMGEEIALSSEIPSKETTSATSYFLRYHRLLGERTQADLLGKLHERLSCEGEGHPRIDVESFLADDDYKERVVFQLASSPDDLFLMVKSLAERYSISLWELFFRRIQFLITDTSISLEAVEKELSLHKMASTFTSDPVLFRSRLDREIVPFLDGADIPRMIFIYALLEECGDLPDTETGTTPGQNLRLIKKLQSSSSDLNYLELLNPSKFEEAVLKTLGPQNVQIFAKNAAMFPKEGGAVHDSSSIYRLYGEKLFFEINNKKDPTTVSEWVHRYESCSDIISKLSAPDYLDFVNRITFSERAVRKVHQDSRVEINRRALKHSKHKEHSPADEIKCQEWQETSLALNNNLEHLRKMEDDLAADLRNSRQQLVQDYAVKFDMTRSVPEKVELVVVEAVLDRLPLPCLQSLLALAPVDMELDPSQAYSKAVQLLAVQLRSPEECSHPYLQGKDPLLILQEVMSDLANDEELLSDDHQMELLSPLLADPHAPATYRMGVADILQKDLDLTEESQQLILRCRTQCLVSGDWPQVELSEVQTDSAAERTELFDRLLSLSDTRDQLAALAHLALSWPKSDTDNLSWVPLFLGMIPLCDSPDKLDEALSILQEVLQVAHFSPQSFDDLYSSLCGQDSMDHILEFAIISDRQDLMGKTRLLLQQKEVEAAPSESLLDLLLEKGLVPWCTGTPLYGPLACHLLETSADRVPQIVEELRAAGKDAEAGALLCAHQEIHPSLVTFSGAWSSLKEWVRQN